MKILKIFGIVVGIHVFALVLIFANPGCSSTTKPAPAPAAREPAAPTSPPVTFAVPSAAPAPSPISAAPVTFNPDAPAMASGGTGGGVRFVPTRPNTPVAGTLVTEPVVDVTPATTYVVKSGDNLWSIAKKHHLSAGELASANHIATSAIVRPGQKLLIPGKSTAGAPATPPAKAAAPTAARSPDAAPASARAASESVKHVVKSGETLGSIARNFGVRQGDIAVANNISDPAKIRAGMELVIPGWQPASGKAGKGAAKSGGSAKGGEARTPAVEAGAAASPAQIGPPPVPIIRIDDNPITPAPKP